MFGLVMVIPNLGISAVRKYISHKCTMGVTSEAEYNAFGIESVYLKIEDVFVFRKIIAVTFCFILFELLLWQVIKLMQLESAFTSHILH